MTLLLVFLGGAVGAPARYLIDRFVQRHHDNVFPWGTLTVNLAGSLILGFLLGAQSALGLPDEVIMLAGTGFCGALTTFSTFSFETVRLLEEGSTREAGLNIIGSLILGVLAATAGHAVAGLFT
ncbi:fluoride efflux transporter CrcB [Sphaerimonospora cavernae]|uniref:Fluoride-specific ion channel FluC n=1 Tax=Sphaerimonospora cavernae TaxID=1740611 RepID=A0ABV6TXG0_9ACTN